MDDILLCFQNWTQAIDLLPSFFDKLESMGLQVNYDKSWLVLSPTLRASAPAPHQLQLLARFPWVEQTQCLRKPIGYNLDAHAMHSQAMQQFSMRGDNSSLSSNAATGHSL